MMDGDQKKEKKEEEEEQTDSVWRDRGKKRRHDGQMEGQSEEEKRGKETDVGWIERIEGKMEGQTEQCGEDDLTLTLRTSLAWNSGVQL